MKVIRRVVMWVVLGGIGLLVILSIGGAFIGVQKSRAMFNSIPMAALWFGVLGLFVAGLLLFKRLIRSPGLLALHLGCLLILAGAMYGSDAGHRVAAKLLDSRKIPRGYMQIFQGRSTSAVIGLVDDKEEKIGDLPFTIHLERFWIERYEETGRWLLGIGAPPAADDDGHNHRRREVIDWAVGEEVDVPFIAARVKVLQYLDGARPVYDEDAAAMLEVVEPDGKKTVLPAMVGQSVPLGADKGTLRITEIFTHLLVRDKKVTNLAGSNANPALALELEQGDGTISKISKRYAFARHPGMHVGKDGLTLRYIVPEPTGAQADPNSELPAMEVLLTYKDKQLRKWLIASDPQMRVELSLAELVGPTPHEGQEGHAHTPAVLMMAARQGPIRDYKSSLVVLDEGNEMAKKVIEVNDPLYYGGYHFYQHSYDERRHAYTVLSVKSDSGLSPVYAGFILLCAGAFWLMWVQPAWKYLFKKPRVTNATCLQSRTLTMCGTKPGGNED